MIRVDEFEQQDREDVLCFARAVAFGMWVNDDLAYADDYLTVMCTDLPEYTTFHLNVVREARRLHAEWNEAGPPPDEAAARVAYGTGA